jgi:type IV pilus assembly protein PilP
MLTLTSLAQAQTEYADDVPIELFDADEQQMREALKLRDPFKRQRQSLSGRGVEIPDGPRTDFSQNIPSIEGVPLRRLRIVGVLLGENRRALAKVANESGGDNNRGMSREREQLSEETFILKEGMLIGENDAELKAILPGGIVLVEKITNVYDQEEYLETIIPITAR